MEGHRRWIAENIDDPVPANALSIPNVEPFEAALDLGRNTGAGIQVRRDPDDGRWQVRHDCSYGNGGYAVPFGGDYATRRAAFEYATERIRREARFPLDADEKQKVACCIGDKDKQRANKILAWLDGLMPPT